MSTDEYVPHESYVRHRYVSGEADIHDTPEWEGAHEFDRFLARVRREAKADGWDEGWKERARRDIYRSGPLDDPRPVPEPPRSLNPYRKTGDQ